VERRPARHLLAIVFALLVVAMTATGLSEITGSSATSPQR
jgi:hypothetical protein